MPQAIETRYLPPTNTRPSRIKAKARAGSVTLSYDHALSGEENFALAARTLAEKFGWHGAWCGGSLSDNGNTIVFVQIESAFTPKFEIAKG